ncbi:MAG: hypothetical protein GYB50_04000 [Rhodobacteraceae bacterium]|nr:hypothetical protein [Paracoccaceae bacterium]
MTLKIDTARLMSNESLREFARHGRDLAEMKPNARWNAITARAELESRDEVAGLGA